MVLRNLYIAFLGVLLALFVGVGISAFYPSPVMPTRVVYPPAPVVDSVKVPSGFDAEKARKQENAWQEELTAYLQQQKDYKRNVSMISLGFAIAFLALSLLVLVKTAIFSDGFLLGGLLTMLYSIVQGFATDNNKYQFLVVAVSVIVVIVLGRVKFISPKQK